MKFLLAIIFLGVFLKNAYGDEDPCQLEPETGMGRASFPSFYYDKETQKCDTFTYGGMGGNNNRFATLKECEAKCANHCQLDAETGMGRAAIPRFYYNKETSRCETFTYGGMGGNNNNFATQGECEAKCVNPAPVGLCGINCEFGCADDTCCSCREEPKTGGGLMTPAPTITRVCGLRCPCGYLDDNGCVCKHCTGKLPLPVGADGEVQPTSGLCGINCEFGCVDDTCCSCREEPKTGGGLMTPSPTITRVCGLRCPCGYLDDNGCECKHCTGKLPLPGGADGEIQPTSGLCGIRCEFGCADDTCCSCKEAPRLCGANCPCGYLDATGCKCKKCTGRLPLPIAGGPCGLNCPCGYADSNGCECKKCTGRIALPVSGGSGGVGLSACKSQCPCGFTYMEKTGSGGNSASCECKQCRPQPKVMLAGLSACRAKCQCGFTFTDSNDPSLSAGCECKQCSGSKIMPVRLCGANCPCGYADSTGCKCRACSTGFIPE